MNPGGSVKDRAALGMVRDAEARGLLQPGGTIVEGTAGNTGIGLAVVGNCLGYETVIVMPDNQSQDKIDTLRSYGARLQLVPAVPLKDPNHFTKVSAAHCCRAERGFRQRRVSGPTSSTTPRTATFTKQTTGAEIWEQTGGEVHAFMCSVGTGGTLAGVARALKARKPDTAIGLADPPARPSTTITRTAN